MSEVFPEDLFHQPLKNAEGKPLYKWEVEPINAELLKREAQKSDTLRAAMNTDMTDIFIRSLYHKATRKPPEDIRMEIKGVTRSAKSTGGIFIGKLLSRWWGHEFTVNNILQNQGMLMEVAEKAKYGETFLIDEQTNEYIGEGVNRETQELGDMLNICAKQCLNLLFIYPPSFSSRGGLYGLETFAKDPTNKYNKFFFHDLRRKAFGFGGIWPHGYIILPKYVDDDYKRIPMDKWSPDRLKNFQEKKYDFDSLLEEQYEAKKNEWIKDILSRDSAYRMKAKEEVAVRLATNPTFLKLKGSGQREAYILRLINRKDIFNMARTEVRTVADMAMTIVAENEEVFE